MAKVKIRILYPTAALARGLSDEDIQEVDEKVASEMIAEGFAEKVKTETATRKPSSSKKTK